MRHDSGHSERHLLGRIGWLRAAVLGANDGVVSTSSLMVGIAAAASDRHHIVLTGLAALVAGAMSMAAGEYVSVSSQGDAEKADLLKEQHELETAPEAEHAELAGIYQRRGVDPGTAAEVARQLMAEDALAAHALDELGLTEIATARPVQAALYSALSFAGGAALPLAAAALAPIPMVLPAVAVVSLLGLALLGVVSAKTGGAAPGRAVTRVVFWGAAAMVVTGLAGSLFGAGIG